MRISLADLGHNQLTLNSDVHPLGIANLATYSQALPTTVEPSRRALIETKVATFGEHPSGLGKFTRTMFAQDLRRTLLRSTVASQMLLSAPA
jgi:hypothetical protein